MALSFNGTDSYIDLGTVNNDLSNGITVAAWVYWNDLSPSPGDGYARIIDLGQGEANDNIILANSGTSDDLIYVVFSGGSQGSFVTAADILDTGEWMHLAATQTGTSVILYKNGVQVESDTTLAIVNVSRNLSFIGRSNWASNSYFDGLMEDHRIYDRVLSAAEIQTIYASRGHDGIVYGLIRRFPMNELGTGKSAGMDTGIIEWTVAFPDSTTVTLDVPTHTDGDLLVAIICPGGDSSGTPADVTTPGGWTLIGNVDLPSTASTPSLWIYRRTASSEPASYDFVANQTTSMNAIMVSYDQNVVDTMEENISSNTGTSASPSAPTISPTANSMILRICASDGLQIPSPVSDFYPDNTIGRLALENSGVGNGCSLGFADHLVGSGATGVATFTLEGSDQWGCFSVSFNGGGGPGFDTIKDWSNEKANGTPENGPLVYSGSQLTYRRK